MCATDEISMEVPKTNIEWERLDQTKVNLEYNRMIINHMKTIKVCLNEGCSYGHSEELDEFYNSFCAIVMDARAQLAPLRRTNSHKGIPGWNEFCRTKYECGRQ